MDAARDYHTKCKSERQIPHDTTYMWKLKHDTNGPSHKAETDSQTEQAHGWGRGGLGEGWRARSGLADVRSYIRNRSTMRSYCIAQGTIFL